jgi:hypothetical protein
VEHTTTESAVAELVGYSLLQLGETIERVQTYLFVKESLQTLVVRVLDKLPGYGFVELGERMGQQTSGESNLFPMAMKASHFHR